MPTAISDSRADRGSTTCTYWPSSGSEPAALSGGMPMAARRGMPWMDSASGQAIFWTETRVPATHTKWLKILLHEADKPSGVRDGLAKVERRRLALDPCSPSSEL